MAVWESGMIRSSECSAAAGQDQALSLDEAAVGSTGENQDKEKSETRRVRHVKLDHVQMTDDYAWRYYSCVCQAKE
jgi:hypothetical protein